METFSNRRAAQQALADWCAQGRLDAADLSTAWAPTLPDRMDWRRWLDRALLILGTALLCAGVIVFFAFNWAALHKFTKFGLLAALLTLLAGFASLRPTDDMAGRAALGGAQIMSGVLMAVIGQTYQTGADAWQLFALWTLLALPWALAARAAPHWWIVLVVGKRGAAAIWQCATWRGRHVRVAVLGGPCARNDAIPAGCRSGPASTLVRAGRPRG